ncbi:Bud-site selection protein [Earliella scabrosa]|nr:Bud-site selection protein [Earliella scabrosa]
MTELQRGARGTKRKRPAGKGPAVQVKQEAPGEIIAKKLHHGLHEVRKAAKKAAAFELRKLVKRLKQARAQNAKGAVKGDDPAEMERQLEVLKNVDHEPFANTALRTKILKDKLLAHDDDVQAAVAEKLSANLVAPQEPGSSAAKVHGRLLSSKTLAEAVHAVVDALREILDPSLAKTTAKTQAKVVAGKEEDEDEDDSEEEEEGETRPAKAKKARVAHEEDGDEDSGGESEGDADDAGWESGTVDDGDDGGWESGTVDGGDLEVASSSEDDGGSSDPDEDEDEPGEASSNQRPETNVRTKKTAGESTFLPSLSVGFTRGDSDASDLSDREGAAADAPRKNRRGQRARRAIWEKKFGKNANHVKNQRQQQQHRNASAPRDSRPRQQGHGQPRGGRDAPGQPPRHAGGGRPEGFKAKNASANGQAGAAKAKEEKALHPSWEAKRKLKEKLNPGIVPPQGKKIIF